MGKRTKIIRCKINKKGKNLFGKMERNIIMINILKVERENRESYKTIEYYF